MTKFGFSYKNETTNVLSLRLGPVKCMGPRVFRTTDIALVKEYLTLYFISLQYLKQCPL